MVIERDPATRFEFASCRLANVVHQRGKTQHEVGLETVILFIVNRLIDNGEGVLENILVVMVFVYLEFESWKFGQN